MSRPVPALSFVEMYREGEGAVGEYSKYGFAQRLARSISYGSVVSQFDLEPSIADREISTLSLPPYPGCDDGADSVATLSEFDVEIHQDVIDFFLKRFKKRLQNPPPEKEPETWDEEDSTPPHSKFRYIWIDRLCIIQGNDEDRRWHDSEFQKDIHAAAAQCFALPYGLLATICTSKLVISKDDEEGRGPFLICRRQTTSSLGDPLLLNLLSAESGLSGDRDGTIILYIRNVMTKMTGAGARPRRSLWEDQATWRALFSRTYDSRSEFINTCWETLLATTSRNPPPRDESGFMELNLPALAGQLSRALAHGAWLGGLTGTPDAACALFPTIPLRNGPSGSSRLGAGVGMNHSATSPLAQGSSSISGDEGRTMFVADSDFHVELSEEGPCIVRLQNTPARRFMRSTKKEGYTSRDGPLQFERVSDSRYYWMDPANPIASGSGKSIQGAEEVWLVYLGSVNVLRQAQADDHIRTPEKRSWVREPDYLGFAANPASRSSAPPRRGIASSSSAAAKRLPSPSAQTYRFAILARHHAESPWTSSPDSNVRPRSAPVPGTFTLEMWVEKEVTTSWLKPTEWSRHDFFIAPQDAAPPYFEESHGSGGANDCKIPDSSFPNGRASQPSMDIPAQPLDLLPGLLALDSELEMVVRRP
ncbi:hypothetical protein TRAPUB_11312 [Trametes pubescens]|uniref:Heterokaryon incompatibility domain-containing protein n=1 Tax=Trametes pubescens TaxID=154538 RepID=A0A1M2VX07_TRAPU|nr:hypothetical protein TRAPUB_11312 [Trametes pubescens]